VAVEKQAESYELPPGDAIVVIRAGVLNDRSIEDAAKRCLEGYGLLGISVEGAMDLTVTETCRTSSRLGRYRQIRLSMQSPLWPRSSRSTSSAASP
jgi:hypothetical protein